MRDPIGDAEFVREFIDASDRYPILTPEREMELATRAAEGDRGASGELVLGNLRLVPRIARHCRDCGVSSADLLATGAGALLRASTGLNPAGMDNFRTQACWRIRCAICRDICCRTRWFAHDGLLLQVMQLRAIREAETALAHGLGRQPTKSELARETGIRPRVLQRLRRIDMDESRMCRIIANILGHRWHPGHEGAPSHSQE